MIDRPKMYDWGDASDYMGDLENENVRLQTALKTYGRHTDACDILSGGCTCGFDELMRKLNGRVE